MQALHLAGTLEVTLSSSLALFLTATWLLVSFGGLVALIWALQTGQFSGGADSAEAIFEAGEVGQTEDPAAFDGRRLSPQHDPLDHNYVALRTRADTSSRDPVLWLIGSAALWLVIGSFFGLIASLKFNLPDWLAATPQLTFGRVRPMHLNAVIYGWLSMAGMGVSLWLLPRLLRTELRGNRFALFGTHLWNLGIVLGLACLAEGYTDGLEWLEFPWPVDILFVIAGALIGIPILMTLKHRQVSHIYVSTWYIGAAFVWFPILFLVGNLPGLHFGVEHAAANWWYAHNVLGLWATPFGLAAAYYFIPKVTGQPIFSYRLSFLGFWSLALFYSQAGIHHLIGGPVPAWLVTLSMVASVSMVIPVIAVAINHHFTVVGHFRKMIYSPTLRFVVLGAVAYTFVSAQGCFQSVRSFNTLTHFTHYTVAHAHMGVYGFVSLILFGSIYFMMPRLTGWEWPYPSLISAHFWSIFVGFAIYFLFLSWGGLLQGRALLDGSLPFLESVRVMYPYFWARTIGGSLMTLGHLLFASHLALMIYRRGPHREEPAYLGGGKK